MKKTLKAILQIIKRSYVRKQIMREQSYEENLILSADDAHKFTPLTPTESAQVDAIFKPLILNKLSIGGG